MIELKGITVGYGGTSVLREVSATIEKGKLTSIIGVNGCGKSTLLKATLGMLPLTDGEILIDGRNIETMQGREIARRIAYLSQGKVTPDMTVGQLVLHGRFPYLSYPRRYGAKDREIAREAMASVGILELADKPLSALSGGMRQTAYIAMALAQDTDYILLDEPTTYLDITHQIELMRLLRRLCEAGRGVVTVMHDLPVAFDFSDKIIAVRGDCGALQAPPREMCDTSLIEETFRVKIERHTDGGYHYKYT